MRRLLLATAFLLVSASPALAGPVGYETDDCGNKHLVVLGHRTPGTTNNVWCPPPPEDK